MTRSAWFGLVLSVASTGCFNTPLTHDTDVGSEDGSDTAQGTAVGMATGGETGAVSVSTSSESDSGTTTSELPWESSDVETGSPDGDTTDTDDTSGTGGTDGTGASGTGTDESGEATSAGSVACDLDTHVCAAQPPPGWSEAFALGSGEDGCGGAFGVELSTLVTDLQADDASCDCGCGAPDVSCPNDVLVTAYSGPGCTVGEGFANVSAAQCYNQVLDDTHSVTVDPPTSSCATGSVSETVPDISWATHHVACAGEAVDATCPAAGDSCLPQPGLGDEIPICIMQPGDEVCPAGYPAKTLYYDGIDDTRECPSACSCSAQGSSCTTTVARFTVPNCALSFPLSSVNVSSGESPCVITGGVDSIRPGALFVDDPGTCVPGVAPPQGQATPTQPTTVCCMG